MILHVAVSSCRHAKFSDLSFYLADNCRTQGTPLGICDGMPKRLSAIAKLLHMRHIPSSDSPEPVLTTLMAV